MKNQQVVVDYWTMLKTSCTCLLLAISGYVLIKMVQTIFYLPGYLKSNQKRLEELADKYNLDLEKEMFRTEMDKGCASAENENDKNKTRHSTKKIVHNDKIDDEDKEPKKVK